MIPSADKYQLSFLSQLQFTLHTKPNCIFYLEHEFDADFFIENKLRMPYRKVHCNIFCQCHGVPATTYLFGKLGSS